MNTNSTYLTGLPVLEGRGPHLQVKEGHDSGHRGEDGQAPGEEDLGADCLHQYPVIING